MSNIAALLRVSVDSDKHSMSQAGQRADLVSPRHGAGLLAEDLPQGAPDAGTGDHVGLVGYQAGLPVHARRLL